MSGVCYDSRLGSSRSLCRCVDRTGSRHSQLTLRQLAVEGVPSGSDEYPSDLNIEGHVLRNSYMYVSTMDLGQAIHDLRICKLDALRVGHQKSLLTRIKTDSTQLISSATHLTVNVLI